MAKRIYTFLLTCIFCFAAYAGPEDRVQKETFLYSVKEQDSLYLDKYEVLLSQETKKPCVLFVFGGGFVGGARDRESYVSFFEHLARKGYVVVSLDYRLGLKMAGEAMALRAKLEKETGVKQKKAGKKDFLYLFDNTISMAVEDLFDATNYVLEHAGEWNIDKEMIVASGSSAGAITVLQAEYKRCNQSALAQRLPEDFNYAGIIAFAGAIFSMEGGLKWNKPPAPILFFHGNADKNVPYDELRVKVAGIKLKYGLFGSKYITRQLDKIKNPYYFYDIERAAHEIADRPMQQNRNEVDIFLDKFVKNKEKLIIHTRVQQPDKPELPTKFGLTEYLKANGLVK